MTNDKNEKPTVDELMHMVYVTRPLALAFYSCDPLAMGPEREDARRKLMAADRELRAYADRLAASPSPEEAEAARPEPAEFCLAGKDDMCLATAEGKRDEAWREIQHYAAQYTEEGPLTIYEVKRTPVWSSQPEAAGTAGGDAQPGGSDAIRRAAVPTTGDNR